VAGRIGLRSDATQAFRAARLIETAIRSATVAPGSDRHEAMAAVWDEIHGIDGCDLGPNNGDDLTILLAAADQDGTGISGMGLGGVWTFDDHQFEPLVQGNHPLLSGPGRPERLAGVLTLDKVAHTIVAVPHEHRTPIPAPSDWKKRCGVNP